MKRLLLILLLTLPALAQTPAYVNSVSSYPGPVTSASVTLTVTAGHLLVIYTRNSPTGDTFTISDNVGDTIVKPVGCDITTDGTFIPYYVAAAVGGSTTVTVSGSNGYWGLVVGEYSGQAVSPYDTCARVDYGGGINPATVGPVTTTTNNELLVGMDDLGLGDTYVGVTAGYTLRQRNLATGTFYDGYWDNTSSNTAGSYSMTVTTGGGTRHVMGLLAFKSSGGGGGSNRRTASVNNNE